VLEQTKKCSRCGEVKARSEFHKRKTSRDGLRCDCKECVKEYKAKYYVENREEKKAATAKYRADNPENVLASRAKYRAKNRGKIKERCSKWRAENPDYDAKYRKANPDKARVKESRRRASLANAQGTHTADQLKARFDYQGNKCVYCDSTENLHADHMIPLSRGGTNFASNMAPACASCNLSKGAKTPEEFLLQQFNIAMDKLINGKI